VADVDNDGFKDIIVGDAFGKVYAFDKDGGLIWTYDTQGGKGDDVFEAQVLDGIGLPAITDVEIADVDGNGVLDVIAVAGDNIYALFTKLAAVGEIPGYEMSQTEQGDGSTDVCVINSATDKITYCANVPQGQLFYLTGSNILKTENLIKITGVNRTKTVYFDNAPSQLCILDQENLASLSEGDTCQDAGEFLLDCPGNATDPNDGSLVTCTFNGTTTAMIGPLNHSGVSTVLGVSIVPAGETAVSVHKGYIPPKKPAAAAPTTPQPAETAPAPQEEQPAPVPGTKAWQNNVFAMVLVEIGIVALIGAIISFTFWYKKRNKYKF
jgi:hypothetical protein